MGLLATLIGKILGKGTPSTQSTTATSAPPPTGGSTPAVAAANPPAGVSAPPPVVDVTAILDDLAKKNPEKLDWRKSIVDLMKLVGMDSSLSAPHRARKRAALHRQHERHRLDERLVTSAGDHQNLGEWRQGAARAAQVLRKRTLKRG
jgi:hypothetical protein